MLSGNTAVIAETGDSWFSCQKDVGKKQSLALNSLRLVAYFYNHKSRKIKVGIAGMNSKCNIVPLDGLLGQH